MEPRQIAGPKVRKLREELGLTQESLAQISKVSIRTVQRAESGNLINRESVAEISAALRVRAEELYIIPRERSPRDPHKVVLRRTTSGREVLENFDFCRQSYLECDVEAGGENADALISLVEVLEKYAPIMTPEAGPYSDNSLAARVQAIAALNTCIARASEIGAYVFLGGFVSEGVVPRYHEEAMRWFTDPSWAPQSITNVMVRISSEKGDRIVASRPDICPF